MRKIQFRNFHPETIGAVIAFSLTVVVGTGMLFYTADSVRAYGSSPEEYIDEETQQIAQLLSDGESTADPSEIQLASVQNVVAAGYHKVIRYYYRSVPYTRCYYLNVSRNRRGYASLPCTARIKVTSTWWDHREFCRDPDEPANIKYEVFMLAWRVSVNAHYESENVCQHVQWKWVTCNVDWSLGWDIKINKCEAIPGIDKVVFFKNTPIHAQWDASFVHSAFNLVRFGHCYRTRVNPANHLIFDHTQC